VVVAPGLATGSGQAVQLNEVAGVQLYVIPVPEEAPIKSVEFP